jgi:hypothetical protein
MFVFTRGNASPHGDEVRLGKTQHFLAYWTPAKKATAATATTIGMVGMATGHDVDPLQHPPDALATDP